MKSLLEMHARELLKQPESWCLYSWRGMPQDAGAIIYHEIKGAIAPPFLSGPRKGKPNWSKKTADLTVCIKQEDHAAWILKWAENTGLCPDCLGEGTVFKSWSKKGGIVTRKCTGCNGDGKYHK